MKENKLNQKLTSERFKIYSIIYPFIIGVKIPFLYSDIQDAYTWKLVVLCIMGCLLLFFFFSRMMERNRKKEMAKMAEDNKQLTARLHKSQEILPAMMTLLSKIMEENKMEVELQNTKEILQEVCDIYGQQVKENSKEDFRLKNFQSTGLKILDQQLTGYLQEAANRDVNMDIYVQAPITSLLHKHGIDQLRFQRTIGDLIRNAFRAVEKGNNGKGHILLIIGCRKEDILEISVMDNGIPFSKTVRDSFGKRGVTTGGYGNGLADLMEFARERKASVVLEEWEPGEDNFTKSLSLVFDRNQEIRFI